MELVYEPAERLRAIFRKWDAPLVVFVEVAELEMIEAAGSDRAIDIVKQQIREFYKGGFELGLHIHPQWYNGRFENRRWYLDYSEYNLCTLPLDRIAGIVERSIAYLRRILEIHEFTPLSFRAGNWLFQPTRTAATVLAAKGIKIDSSVFKGGLQHQHKLDYRESHRNGSHWRFTNEVNVPDPEGIMLEFPIYTDMVPTWKIFTSKRLSFQRRASSSKPDGNGRIYRIMDFLRLSHPLKLDFCRMTIDELTRMMDGVIREDRRSPRSFKPIVAIGHTKDLVDLETVESFLDYLSTKGISLSTFEKVSTNYGI